MISKACVCGGIVRDNVCNRCGPKKRGHRKSRHQRGYGNDWERLSKRTKREFPLCVPCWQIGRVTPAGSTHHIVKIRDAPELRLDRDNLLTVCESCHGDLDALYERDRRAYDVRAIELKHVRDELLDRRNAR